jgi:hypothetical protein
MKESEISNLADRDRPRKRYASPRRHARVCAICRHPQRAAIDRDFLDWRSLSAIVSQYGLRSRNAVQSSDRPRRLTATNPSNVAVRPRRTSTGSSQPTRYTPAVAIKQMPATQRDNKC